MRGGTGVELSNSSDSASPTWACAVGVWLLSKISSSFAKNRTSASYQSSQRERHTSQAKTEQSSAHNRLILVDVHKDVVVYHMIP